MLPPSPSQSRMCRFPASGSSRESFAHSGVAVDDPGSWERVPLEEVMKPIPQESAPPPQQPHLPDPCDLMGVPANSSKVSQYAVVGIVAVACTRAGNEAHYLSIPTSMPNSLRGCSANVKISHVMRFPRVANPGHSPARRRRRPVPRGTVSLDRLKQHRPPRWVSCGRAGLLFVDLAGLNDVKPAY